MNASELEQLWKRQPSLQPSGEDITRIAATVAELDRTFRRKIRARDLREIGAAVVVAIAFGLAAQTWLRWICVASSVFVIGVIIWSRLAVRPPRENPSVVGRLQQMLRETQMQIRLLRSVLWWYLVPCAVVIVAFSLDRFSWKANSLFLEIFGTTTLALFVFVYWLNQREVRKVLEPRRAKLQKMLSDLSANR